MRGGICQGKLGIGIRGFKSRDGCDPMTDSGKSAGRPSRAGWKVKGSGWAVCEDKDKDITN